MIPVSSDDELWKSGKSDDNTTEANKEEDSTLDLSSPSPDDGESDDLDLSPLAITDKEINVVIPAKDAERGLSMEIIGAIGATTILILMGFLYILLAQQNIIIQVPYEQYEEEVTYDIQGSINFDSSLDIPLPIGFIDNDIVINELDIVFSGELKTGIKAPSTMIIDGYGNDRSVFKKYLEQNLDDIDGTIKQEGENPASLENAESVTFQHQFVDTTSLEIVRTDIESNASYSDTLTGESWYWQGATDWVPRDSESGLLPHGNSYIGQKLEAGTKGTINDGGIEFNWKVTDGGKVDGVQTALLKISTSYVSDSILGYQYQYQYDFDFYLSEESSMPLKFKLKLNSDASSPSGKLYAINFEYQGTTSKRTEGYTDVPTTPINIGTNIKTGEFSPWIDGAPAFGNGSCGLDSSFTLQTGIEKGKDEVSGFNSYFKDQENKNKPSFIIEAIAVDMPIMSMEDIPMPLTVCSAEEVMTDFDEISSWAVNDQTKNVDYSNVKLLLGQNLVSKQSLASPTSIINFGSLNLVNVVSDLSQGNLNPNDYSNNIDVNTAGSYAYFLDKRGTDHSGNNYQKLAGVDAKDGLVLFDIQSINSN